MTFEEYRNIISKRINCLKKSTFYTLENGNKSFNIAHPNAQEPDLIANLVNKTIIELAHEWNNILNYQNIAFSVTSVFTHQSPKVKYKGAIKNPEIGDLLIVYIHYPKKGAVRRTALLLQAKKTDITSINIKESDHQFKLYNKWPKFNLLNKKYAHINFNVLPKKAHKGGQYLLIRNNSKYRGFYYMYKNSSFDVCESQRPLVSFENLSEILVKMLLFKEGKSFKSKKNSLNTNDWSNLIWILLELTLTSTYNRRKINHVKVNRQTAFASEIKDIIVSEGIESEEGLSVVVLESYYDEDNDRENFLQ